MKTNITLKHIFAATLLACGCFLNANADDGNIYVYKNGSVKFMVSQDKVDRIALEENKTKVSFYDSNNTQLYTASASDIDNISFDFTAPVADMLDVQFGEDGSVTDVSPMNNPIETYKNNNGNYVESTVPTYYSDEYGRYVATYANKWGAGDLGTNGVYSKMDFASNEDFINKLKDGHTLETIVRVNEEVPDAESKWFSAHEAGGTGLMICKKKNGLNGEDEITFLPNVSADGTKSKWIWCTSGVTPEVGTFYDVVGVWNKEEGKAYVYINGELANTVDAAGKLHLPNKEAARWFGIGCDAGTTSGQFGGNWDIVSAKIYDAPLTEYDVKMMYEKSQQ